MYHLTRANPLELETSWAWLDVTVYVSIISRAL